MPTSQSWWRADMARALWSGSINFGLVNVPVKAFTAVRDHDVHFHQLDKKSGSRIRYQKVAEETGKEVDQDEIAMGYDVGNGRYVTFDAEEMKAVRPKSNRVIEIADFVALDDIDPIYFQNTYWLVPSNDAAKKSYQLLVAAMDDEERVGVGSVVLRDRQHLAALRPLDGALAMSTMRFADEVVPRRDIEGLPKRAKPEPKALNMAKQLIDGMTTDWDPERYRDTYTDELRKRIKAKESGKEVVESDEKPTVKVHDLMAALEASVEAARERRTPRKATRKAVRKAS
ncbi:MAG TPA: Ku protein [Ilumatobacteraceae bacterium]|nr:Ku protein [Ilumatobacteraceae bacterium]